MFGKTFIGLCGILGGAYFLGAFGGGGFERVVGAPPDAVRAALMDLDIRSAPGEPATDPTRSGGVDQVIELTHEGNDMVWTAMSGNDVAIQMIAHLEPVDGGTKTRVTAEVRRGNAPDDFVAPAFRSAGVTLGLFSIVLEDELDELVRPAAADPATCQKIVDDFTESGPAMQEPGFATVASATIRLSALESKLKAAGCPTGFDGPFEMPEAQMTDSGSVAIDTGTRDDGVPLEPGAPMVELSKR